MMEKNFQYWITLLGFSIISLVSMVKHFDDELGGVSDDWSTEQRWVVSVAATSLCVSTLACIFHFTFKEIFVGKLFEFGMVIVVLALWCAGLPTILDNEHAIAVEKWRGILNGNIFFSSWGALAFALLLFSKHVQLLLKREDLESFVTWIFFGAASVVVIATGSIYFEDNDCSDLDDVEECNRSVLGITIGTISVLFSLLASVMKLPDIVNHIMSISLVVMWAFAAGYMTFDDGPATEVGTQYFATWAAFLLILHLGSTSFEAMVAMVLGENTTDAVESNESDAKVVDLGAKNDNEDVEEEEVGEQI